jgi:hypothetical protein
MRLRLGAAARSGADDERVDGAAHHSEQHVVRSDDDHQDRIERSIAVEARQPREAHDDQGQNDSDGVFH